MRLCRDAVRAFLNEEVSGFPVVDDEQKLVGVISLSDILWYEALYDEEDIKVRASSSCTYDSTSVPGSLVAIAVCRYNTNVDSCFDSPHSSCGGVIKIR
jgi:CBS-domain-containing membrane protein